MSKLVNRWATVGLVVLLSGVGGVSTKAQQITSVPDSVRVPVLVYHSVAPHHPGQTAAQRQLDVDTAVFEQQMRYIVDHGYHVISLATLIDALEGTSTLPERAVVITFDDGWASQYRYAFPILRQLGLTATFFIYSKPIGHDPLWMNWGQIRELQDAGMTIGSHSRTHPLLTDLRVSLQDEIDDSREDIKRMTGKLPAFFAYPYGAWDPRSVAQVEAAGYRAGRALPGGPWNSPTNRFALHSVLITDDMEVFERELGP